MNPRLIPTTYLSAAEYRLTASATMFEGEQKNLACMQ
jgi:hypothetical protein